MCHHWQVDVAQAVGAIDRSLREAGTVERAEAEKRYLKSNLKHYGVTVPSIRKIAKAFLARSPDLDRTVLLALVAALWDRPVHECRFMAVELLTLRHALLEPRDVGVVEGLIRESKTWALVDPLAAVVAGNLVVRHPDADRVLDRWAGDDDFWVRRSALLAHLKPLARGEGDFDRFGRYADAMLEEKEFFIRKAIGWVLRDTARKRPDLVYQWIAPRAHRAAGVTVREAVKRLSPIQADAVLNAYRSGEPLTDA